MTPDKQHPSTGKVENDHNRPGQQSTQRNEGQRTPRSRHDREAHIGSDNQTQSRRNQDPPPTSGKSRGAD